LFAAAFSAARRGVPGEHEGAVSFAEEGEGLETGSSLGKSSNARISHEVRLALVLASRENPASVPERATWAPLSAAGALLDGDSSKTIFPEPFAFDPKRVVFAFSRALEAHVVSAQRLVVAEWLARRDAPFSDARPVSENAFFSKPVVAFSARLSDARGSVPSEEDPDLAIVEIAFGGVEGIELTVRSKWVPGSASSSSSSAVLGTAAVPGCGGSVRTSTEDVGGGKAYVARVRYPGSKTSGVGVSECIASAACADAHRIVSNLAFAKRVETCEDHCFSGRVLIEAFSCVVGRERKARVAWVGASGPTGGLAAACLYEGCDEATEAAVSEAARVGDVKALFAALDSEN
jgi:hypothetical protein